MGVSYIVVGVIRTLNYALVCSVVKLPNGVLIAD